MILQVNQVFDSENEKIAIASGTSSDVNLEASEQTATDADGDGDVNPQGPGQGDTDANSDDALVRIASLVSGATILINDDAKHLSNMVKSHDGALYFVTFIDDHSRKLYILFEVQESDVKLPDSFWAEALNTAAYIINLSPTIVLNGDVSDRVWYAKLILSFQSCNFGVLLFTTPQFFFFSADRSILDSSNTLQITQRLDSRSRFTGKSMAATSVHKFAQCISCHAWSPDLSSNHFSFYSPV
ncbi:hypothetical protein MTR67_021964 [Solanum verrucosum]|uniref:Uncharacterized protein n=1 Tax=Solanum verrucosum TaxID=315347 RepID=A0AAF0QZ36_SOLVR|nr:hypothetical protein MTR67_021964 [Solanum verrucosum]